MARRAKYHLWLEEDSLTKIRGWALDGLTEEEIAKNMDISRKTLHVWKNKYPAIGNVLKESKEVADRAVEDSLYKRALGYEYEETETWVTTDSKGKEERRVKRTKRVALPDTTAQIFWLKNRKRDTWRSNPDSTPESVARELEIKRKELEIKRMEAEIKLMESINQAGEDSDFDKLLQRLVLSEIAMQDDEEGTEGG